MPAPSKIRIPYEDDDAARFNCVGRCTAGPPGAALFMAFVTGAYPRDPATGLALPDPRDPDWPKKKAWYGVVHVFDEEGGHLATVARLGGYEADGRQASCARAFDLANEVVATLGELEFCDIEIQPFGLEIDGYPFGLEYVEEDGSEYVMLWPNDVMFHPPWDGSYST